VKEDRLGLDAIYIQAKRYSGSVGAPAIRDFVGALSARQATKGVFITTGRFTPDAREFIQALKTTRVVAVDGRLLADLMIEFNLGVTLEQTYEIKRINSDFFEE
jgi:restriction system protein